MELLLFKNGIQNLSRHSFSFGQVFFNLALRNDNRP